MTLYRSFLLLLATAALSACQDQEFPTLDELATLRSLPRLSTLPQSTTNQYLTGDAAKVTALTELGRGLFSEKRLSGCNAVSCSSCHPAPTYADDKAFSQGCDGKSPTRHTPTLLNVAFDAWYMWDGRADSLWAQASLPLFNPVEMASPSDGSKLLEVLELPEYAPLYQTAFGKPVAEETDRQRVVANFGKALEAYQRTLVTKDTEFDRQVRSFIAASEEREDPSHPFYLPLKTFFRRGNCIVCHKTPNLSDGRFHNIGLDPGGPEDQGRQPAIAEVLGSKYNGLGIYSDDIKAGERKLSPLKAPAEEDTLGAFRTPTLRNVSLTAPYMHNGALQTLEDVIEFYNRGGDTKGFAGTKTVSIHRIDFTPSEKNALLTLLRALEAAPPAP